MSTAVEQQNSVPARGWARCSLADTEIIALVQDGDDAAEMGLEQLNYMNHKKKAIEYGLI